MNDLIILAAVFMTGVMAGLALNLVLRMRKSMPEAMTGEPELHIDDVHGRLIVDVWELSYNDGVLYRAYSEIDPVRNTWLSEDGKKPEQRVRNQFTDAINYWRLSRKRKLW